MTPRIATLACLPDDAAEQRVIAAVLAEPDKLAFATDLELRDFTNAWFGGLLGAIRNLQAAGKPSGPVDVFVYLVDEAVMRGVDAPDDLTLRRIADLIANTKSYEDTYGPAAIAMFDGDLRVLRKIRQAREVVMGAA